MRNLTRPGGKPHLWTGAELEYLDTNYGYISVNAICSALGLTHMQVYSKAKAAGLSRRSRCKICGKTFDSRVGRSDFYCSKMCRRKGRTFYHRKYVEENRAHIREYATARRRRIWGVSSQELAVQAENVAMARILPKLGFTDLYHASAANKFVPFDIIATYQGQRTLIDVSTATGKTLVGTPKMGLVKALRLPFYLLFIKPDFTRYQLTLCDGSRNVAMHPSELSPLE